MVFKLPRMTKSEILNLIKENNLCRIAFKEDDYPYMAPFQYVYHNGMLYFHFTHYGKKMKLLDRDKRVCVEIEEYAPDLSDYKFVVLRGSLDYVTDPREREEVIGRMVEQGRSRLSSNFLAAHGIDPRDGWSSLDSKQDLLMVKLVSITEEIGLKSPSVTAD